MSTYHEDAKAATLSIEDRWPTDLAACHGRMDALRAALRQAEDALAECVPYVNRARNEADPDNAPWRIDTANGVHDRLTAARDRIAREVVA